MDTVFSSIIPVPTSTSQHHPYPAGNHFTVSQLVEAYANWYFTGERQQRRYTSNYAKLVKKYLIYCLKNNKPVAFGHIDYRSMVKPSYISPVKSFLFFYQQLGCPPVTSDPIQTKRAPAGNELVLQFIYEAGQLRGDESKSTYQKSLNAFFLWLEKQRQQGDMSVGFDGPGVERFVHDCRQRRLSPFTINLRIAALKALAKWVLENAERFSFNEVQKKGMDLVTRVTPLATEKTFYKEALTKQQRYQLIEQCTEPLTTCLVSLMVYSGLRTVELIRLRHGDINLVEGMILVLGKGKYTQQKVKLFKPTMDHLRCYLEHHHSGCADDLLFPQLTTRKVRHHVDAIFLKSGLKAKGISAHSLRHTAAQLLLEAGVDGVYVQQHLRHARFDTTQLYTKRKTKELYMTKLPDDF
ncbi:tyrosine-type recombinase/integrase [Rudanella paleaurantiibacter]|uniref:Tyrosine-type recombinase/integrase n=1 Tax=Rudanella paleaurantiibacter TaxID=2614655 RepID=A0A7J5TT53_9BACT|nr:tyrosine-type recombinase/integrase [Rudanella paleaurantiibacter]KAB7726635.1 tyrosine-type recombinase/integrase [Rudanella paleaurantiibacter]